MVKIGEVDATSVCRWCRKDIEREFWGDGGWSWVHAETKQSVCVRPTHAEPPIDWTPDA